MFFDYFKLFLVNDKRNRCLSSIAPRPLSVFALVFLSLVCLSGFADDSDNDGMLDTWEIDNGLDPLLAFDAWWDADRDGVLNKDEFIAETDPNVSSGPAQVVYSAEQAISAFNLTTTLPLYYTTTDASTSLSGLGLNIHYNSSLIPELIDVGVAPKLVIDGVAHPTGLKKS